MSNRGPCLDVEPVSVPEINNITFTRMSVSKINWSGLNWMEFSLWFPFCKAPRNFHPLWSEAEFRTKVNDELNRCFRVWGPRQRRTTGTGTRTGAEGLESKRLKGAALRIRQAARTALSKRVVAITLVILLPCRVLWRTLAGVAVVLVVSRWCTPGNARPERRIARREARNEVWNFVGLATHFIGKSWSLSSHCKIKVPMLGRLRASAHSSSCWLIKNKFFSINYQKIIFSNDGVK